MMKKKWRLFPALQCNLQSAQLDFVTSFHDILGRRKKNRIEVLLSLGFEFTFMAVSRLFILRLLFPERCGRDFITEGRSLEQYFSIWCQTRS